MDLSTTQVYEDEDFPFTQKISHALEEEEPVQVGTLKVNSNDYVIKTGTTKIGRHGSCHIVINDATVSKLHAEIEASGGQDSTWISDLNSSNKTKLNNLILRPSRLYELKHGSIIELGRVHATYHVYCPANDTMVPETPVPPRQKVTSVLIPNTPDSSFNNSSSVDDDGHILETQGDMDSVFRRPRIPQNQSSSSKKNTDSRVTILLTSDITDISENRVSIFDAETQKFEKGYKVASKFIHDIEIQEVPTYISEHLVETNAKTDKQMSKLNVHDKIAGRSMVDIHNIETQNYIDDINEIETQKSKTNIQNLTGKKFTTDIHSMKTQNYADDTDKDSNVQKFKIGKNNDREENLIQTGCKSYDIHNLKTQKFDNIAKDISDLETQLELDGIARCEQNRDVSDLETQLKLDDIASCKQNRDISDLETQLELDDIASCEQNRDISDLETQLELDDIARYEQSRDIFDIETQFIADATVNETSNNRVKKDRSSKDKDGIIKDANKDGINHENITKSPKSRSSSPGSLNLSSPGIEDCPSSPLNQSGHLLESSYLLEFFGEGIDKQKKMQACNTSTPKSLTKVSSERNSNVENVRNSVNSEENNDEDIFEAPTQCISRKFKTLISNDSETNKKNALAMCKVPKKNHGKPQSKQTNDDSEMDAEEYVPELAKKQRESSRTLNKLSNEDISNRNDLGTSAESEDMFDVLTQSLNNPTSKNTSDSSINPPQKSNEINKTVDDMRSMQIINNIDRANISDINDATPTQLILSCETSAKTINSTDFATKNNQNDINTIATMHIINANSIDCTTENLDCENINYELAPTQAIDEIEDKEKKNSNCEKDSSQINSTETDTVEQNLNEMFDDINNDINNIHESQHMSTQNLEDILESPKRDDLTDKSIVGRSTHSVLRKQLKKKNHVPNNQHLPGTEVNANNVNKTEIDSQNSDVYFSAITTRRKRNILTNTQEFMEVTPCKNLNSSRVSKDNEKAMDDNPAMKFNERKKRISKRQNKSDVIMETLNDNNKNEITLSGNNKRSLRISKSIRQKDEIASEINKQILRRDLSKFKVNDAEENTLICTPCSSKDEQRVQTLDTLYEIDDDILTRLPAVRISGTLSNPVSPSASSTSTVRSTRYKLNIAKSKRKKRPSFRKESRERDDGNLGKNDKPSFDNGSNSILDISTTVKISGFADTSEDSETDNETKYKRFQQMADRMLGNELSRLAQQNKETKCIGDKRKIRSNRERKREREESVEQITSKKRKTAQDTEECPVSVRSRRNTVETVINRQFPKFLDTKMSLRGNSPILLRNMKFPEDNKTISKTALEKTQDIFLNTETDGIPERSENEANLIRRTRRNRQVTIHINDITANENSRTNEPVQIKETRTQVNQLQNKVLRILLSPIKSLADDESQEVERLMAKGPNNVQDKNLSIRESSKAKMFQRELRTRSRKRIPNSNSDIEADSILIESGMSSETRDSDNVQLDNPILRTKRGRFAKSSVFSLSEAQVSKKKETFKKPTHMKTSTSLTLDSSAENTINENSQKSTKSDISTNSRISRSKTASSKKKMKLNQRVIDENASGLNTSIEITSVSTPSRTRRNTSILSNSILSAVKHKVLFTGITEDYSKIVKMLGGSKVEDPAKCTILVTDKVRRTYKFLCALAKGIPIVAIDWLKDSETTSRFLDWENYILKDPAAEAKFGFRLRKSLDKAKEKKLLDGYIVVLTSNVTPPPIEELKDMISSCGGRALLRPPTIWPERAVVLSREEDLPTARKFLIKAPKTVTIQSTEFILTGILRQETDFDKHKLT